MLLLCVIVSCEEAKKLLVASQIYTLSSEKEEILRLKASE